ncbi:MAG TPA: site-2 protease family protein [Thermoleophilia bacterium]|nr:site-2 protease family protein [Thermoleophilia bacterium]
MSDSSLLVQFLIVSPLLIVSLVLHELAHGWVAFLLGDPTAKLNGRLTLNPIAHMDTWGTVMLAASFLLSRGTAFLGWAKPVPVDPRHFKDGQRGMAWVGAAGPLTNFAMAFVAVGLIWLTYSWSLYAARLFLWLLVLNVILGTLNLIPVPPLDGSRVLGGFLPRQAYRHWVALDKYGTYTFILLFIVIWQVPAFYDATIGAMMNLFLRLLP